MDMEDSTRKLKEQMLVFGTAVHQNTDQSKTKNEETNAESQSDDIPEDEKDDIKFSLDDDDEDDSPKSE